MQSTMTPPVEVPQGRRTRFKELATTLVEIILLIALPAYLLPWQVKLRTVLAAEGQTHPLQMVATTMPPIKIIGYEIMIMYFFWAVPLLLLTHLSRGRTRRRIGQTAYLLLAWLLVTYTFGLLYMVKSYPVYLELIHDTPRELLPTPLIPVSVLIHIALPIVFWLAPFAFAVACSGRGPRFKFVKFTAGFLAAELFMLSVAHGRAPWYFWSIVDTLIMFPVAAMTVLLPTTRRRIERLLGYSIGSNELADVAPVTWVSEALRRLTIATLTMSIPVVGAFGYMVRQFNYVYEHGPAAVHQSPALNNAYGDWKNYFFAGDCKDFACSDKEWPFCKDFGDVGKMLFENTPSDLAVRAFHEFNYAKELQSILDEHQPYIEALEKARSADYFEMQAGDRLRPGVLRSVYRAIYLRALLRIHQGRPDEAIYDMETLYKVGDLLRGGPALKSVMGVMARGFALQISYHYYLEFHGDSAQLQKLEASFLRASPMIRKSLEVESIRRHEPQDWPIMLIYETSMLSEPGKQLRVYYSTWAGYDILIIALALERFRVDHANYPESLKELVPQYLPKLPKDPYNGFPYNYKNLGKEFELTSPVLKESTQRESYYYHHLPVFPPSRMDNPELREKLAMRSAEIESPALAP